MLRTSPIDPSALSWDSLLSAFPKTPSGVIERETPPVTDLFLVKEDLDSSSELPSGSQPSSYSSRKGTVHGRAFESTSSPTLGKKLNAKKLDLVTRGCRGGLQDSERYQLHEFLLSLEADQYELYIREAHRVIEERNMLLQSVTSRSLFRSERSDSQLIQLTKTHLDFGFPNQDLPLDSWLTDTVQLTNIAKSKQRITVSILVPPLVGQYQFRVKTPSVVVTKKQPENLEFEISFKCTVDVRMVLELIIEDGPSQFLIVKVRSETSQFGVPISTLSLVEDHAYNVPSILATLRTILAGKNGLLQEGIFRLAGDESEMKRIRMQLNQGNHTDTDDLNAVACLIKLWYRDCPELFLNHIDPQFFANDLNEDSCVAEFQKLPEPVFSLLAWLFELFVDVAYYSSTNKMNTKNLAIVIAPNLYKTSDQISPVESLLFSQKVAAFIYHVLNFFFRRRLNRPPPS
eukprot:TRINITY_DN8435_c0_g1_i1.p1 TRINITY_DN8435_c0_g1~~TRINITY_DN8435_c0_g1_i1.p1  ORF type:complete len:459 (+),score=85.73 TRINITY_DN8435_c0_g1_i1:67-1443(+)